MRSYGLRLTSSGFGHAVARWAWLAPFTIGVLLAATALTLINGTRSAALPGSFEEAELYVEQLRVAALKARDRGDTTLLLQITDTARQTAPLRTADLLSVAPPEEAARIEEAVFNIATAAELVGASERDPSALDAAAVPFLEAVGRLQDSLIEDDTAAFGRLKQLSIALVAVLAVGVTGSGAAMLYSDRARHRVISMEQQSARVLASKNRQLEELVRSDPLTGLLSREALIEEMQARATSSAGGQLAVVYLDLDRFKVTNDALGHGVGDALLVTVAQLLRSVWPEPNLMARLGGDEFVLTMQASSEAAVSEALAALRDKLNTPVFVAGFELDLPVSIGVAIGPEDGATPESLVAHADLAMFEAKRAGGNRIARFKPEMDQRAADRRTIEAGLRIAIARDEFRLEYQPIVEVNTGEVESLEALIRWDHPEGGVVPPDEFIGVAEETGLISLIGDWALEEAIRQVAAWQRSGQSPSVSVNVSPRQLHIRGIARRTSELLARYAVAPSAITLEITEEAVLDPDLDALAELTELRAIGVRIALDDFGVGYSSLARFQDLPLDVVKIDRAFIAAVQDPAEPPAQDVAVIEAAVLLAHAHGVPVVAEGIETEAQRALVEQLGCDFAQGFLFGRPVSPDEVMPQLTTSAA